MFETAAATPGVPSEMIEAFRAEWSFLAKPGARWSGSERVAVARTSRAAWDRSTPVTADDPVDEAAVTLGGRPGVVRSPLVDRWYEAGLDPVAYVEIVGVTARLAAVDTFHRAMGLPLEPLPEPIPGVPGGENPPRAAKRSSRSFAPTVGPPTIPSVLSAVPAENQAWIRLADAMYLTFEEMEGPDVVKDLHRTQIEVVAARTSLINECFF